MNDTEVVEIRSEIESLLQNGARPMSVSKDIIGCFAFFAFVLPGCGGGTRVNFPPVIATEYRSASGPSGTITGGFEGSTASERPAPGNNPSFGIGAYLTGGSSLESFRPWSQWGVLVRFYFLRYFSWSSGREAAYEYRSYVTVTTSRYVGDRSVNYDRDVLAIGFHSLFGYQFGGERDPHGIVSELGAVARVRPFENAWPQFYLEVTTGGSFDIEEFGGFARLGIAFFSWDLGRRF